jgi:hypothetical protein
MKAIGFWQWAPMRACSPAPDGAWRLADLSPRTADGGDWAPSDVDWVCAKGWRTLADIALAGLQHAEIAVKVAPTCRGRTPKDVAKVGSGRAIKRLATYWQLEAGRTALEGNEEPRKPLSLRGFRLQLPGQDSNLDKENQNLLCYRYTTG